MITFEDLRARLEEVAEEYNLHVLKTRERDSNEGAPLPSYSFYVDGTWKKRQYRAEVVLEPETLQTTRLETPFPVPKKVDKILLGRRTRITKQDAQSFRKSFGEKGLKRSGRYHYVEASSEPLVLWAPVLLPEVALTRFDIDRVQAETTLLLMQLGFEPDRESLCHLKSFIRALVTSRVPHSVLDDATDEVLVKLLEHYTRGKSAHSFPAYIRRCVSHSAIRRQASVVGQGAAPTDEWVCVREAAATSGLPPSSIYRLASQGKVASSREEEVILVSLPDLVKIKRKRQIRLETVQYLTGRGLKRNSAFHRINRAEVKLGKPLDAFTELEIIRHVFCRACAAI